jgi:hypothetical protein
MKARMTVFAVGLIVLLLGAINSTEAQTTIEKPKKAKKEMTLAEIVAALKPGQWVRLKGIVRKDLPILCTDVRFLTGDFLDDDWTLTGLLSKIDQEKQQIEILGLPIKINKGTVFQKFTGTGKGFADLEVDMLLQVQGTYLKDGTFLAKEVENETGDLITDPEEKYQVDATGKVDKIDSAKRRITLMGITFQLTDQTKGKSVVR